MSECAGEVRFVWSLLVLRNQPVGLLTNLQPNRQKEHLFQVPRMSFPRVCLSPGQQGKAHPHVVLNTFQSAMRAAQSLDILMERVIQSRHGLFSSRPGGQGPGPIPHLSAAIEARPSKGPAEVRGHPLSQDRVGFA